MTSVLNYWYLSDSHQEKMESLMSHVKGNLLDLEHNF